MLAVLETGGKQYYVKNGDVIKTDKLVCNVGDKISFDRILALKSEAGETKFGLPYLENAKVMAEVLSNEKDKKVIVFKKKRRKNYRRKLGHRQHVSILRITEIKE